MDGRAGHGSNSLDGRIQADVAAPGEVFHTGARLANGFCQRAAIVSCHDIHALCAAIEEPGARLAG